VERRIFKLEKLSTPWKWALLTGLMIPALLACYTTASNNDAVISPLFLFYLPLCLSFVLFGTATTAILCLVIATFSIANQSAYFSHPRILVFFIAGIVMNYFYFRSRLQEKELQEFQFQKNQDELELNIIEAKVSNDKVLTAYQANLVKIQKYTALNELARSLAMTNKIQDVVSLLIETISKTFMVPGGIYVFLMFDSSIGKALHAVRYNVDTDMENRLNREHFSPQDTFNAWVVAQAKSLFVNDTTNDFRFLNYSTDKKIQSLVAAPLLAGTEVLGLIRMESSLPAAFRQEDARLFSSFCDLGTVALEHVALYQQAIELAITDGLTGLYVQRYYKDRVKDEVFRALEHQLPLCLMMIDVDNFKDYNDRYGHLVGDRVLIAVAQVLKESVRTVDLVSRYGGEEFSVLLLKTPRSGARIVAERIRQKVEEQKILVSQQATHVTVSIGIAELNPSFKEVEKFIDSADQALYQAKAEGKNCIRLAKPGATHA
jgi:diguanylate cyclase (GGDEF)-like protein